MSDYEFDPFASPAECEVPHNTHDSDEDFTILELLATDIEAVAAFDRYCSQAQFAKALRAIRSRVATIEALRRRVAEYEQDLNAGRELMRTAWSEMNAIRARDGAPSGVSHEWWSAITDQLQHLLKDDANPWMLGAARVMFEQHETHRIRAAEGERDSYEQIADEYARKACDLTAENAELKRQVETLREACEAADKAFQKFWPEPDSRYGMAWAKIQEALAAKGEVEG